MRDLLDKKRGKKEFQGPALADVQESIRFLRSVPKQLGATGLTNFDRIADLLEDMDRRLKVSDKELQAEPTDELHDYYSTEFLQLTL